MCLFWTFSSCPTRYWSGVMCSPTSQTFENWEKKFREKQRSMSNRLWVWSCVYYIITKSGIRWLLRASKVAIISSPFAWICRHVPVQNRDSRRIDRFSCQSHTSKCGLWILATLPDDYTIISYSRNDVYHPTIRSSLKKALTNPKPRKAANRDHVRLR